MALACGVLLSGMVPAQTLFPTTIPPVVTSAAFLEWAPKYVDDSVASAPLERAQTYFFSPDGDDVAGNGTVDQPFQSIAKANQLIGTSQGNVRIRFHAGKVFRSAIGLVVDQPMVTVDSYLTPSDPKSAPKPVMTRFEASVSPSDWQVEPYPGTFSTPVTGPVAWMRYAGDETTVFRRMTSLVDCAATAGSWYCDGDRLFVHSFSNHSLVNTDKLVEYVLKNQSSGILVKDVANVRIHNVRVEGYGAGTPGDHSYDGYGIKSEASGANRCVVTECESYYNGRHSITKVGTGSGGSLVVVRCRMGWLVNDGLNIVCYSQMGGQELVSANNEFLGGELPDTNTPYPYGGGSAPVYLHTANDFAYKQAFLLSFQDRIVPGQYQCSEIVGTICAPYFSALSDCRSFVVGMVAKSRTPSAFDETKPSSNGGNGQMFKQLGWMYTAYVGCEVSPTVLWTQSGGDTPVCSSAFGLWINSEITFDFSHCDADAGSRVLSVSSTTPNMNYFQASFYGCRLRFVSAPGGGVLGFSGPMVHQGGNYYNNMGGRWMGVMKASIVDVQGLSTGRFLLGFGNNSSYLDNNAYYGLTDESGAYGSDQDLHRVVGTNAMGRPQSGSELLATDPILVMGQLLQYDKNGLRRGKRPAIGPVEGKPTGLPNLGGPGVHAGG